MEHIFFSLVGLTFILFGLSVFKDIEKLSVITTPLWNLLENRLKGKGSDLSESKRKLYAVLSVVIGFVLVIGSINQFIDQLKWEQKREHIVNEANRLGMSVEDYTTIDSALFYMPPNSTVEDYKKIDEKAKKSGFTDGYSYLLEEQSAKKDGKTIDQVIAERAKRKAEEEADRKAEEEKEQQAKAYTESSNQSSEPIAISAYCVGYQSGAVKGFITMWDSGSINYANQLLRDNGCIYSQYNFTKANSSVIYEGSFHVALKINGEEVYAVTTKDAWARH